MNNMKWIKVLLLFILCFVLQTTVAEWLKIFGAGPDFVIILIVAISIKYGPAAGCFWGFCAGFTQDIYGPTEWLGSHSISLCTLGFVVGQLEERFLTLNLPAKVGVLGFGFLVCDALCFLLTGLEKDVVTSLFITKTVPECVYTMVIGAIVFHLSVGKKKRHV